MEPEAQVSQFLPKVIFKWGLRLLVIIIIPRGMVIMLTVIVIHGYKLFVETLILLSQLCLTCSISTTMLYHAVGLINDIKWILSLFGTSSWFILRQGLGRSCNERKGKRVTVYCCIFLCSIFLMSVILNLGRVKLVTLTGISSSLGRFNRDEVMGKWLI
jgi:hypothetical protein